MAYKSKLLLSDGTIIDGYKENDDLGLALVDGIWAAVHVKTGNFLAGPRGKWKMKRECLAFVKSLQDANMRWDFNVQEEMFRYNGGFDEVKRVYNEAVARGSEA